jgi:hypothetical protein
MDCRHELKFLVRDVDLALLDRRIRHIARPDPHQKDEDGYTITSLYFDDFYDRCHRETVNGCDNRRKYRLRIYGHSSGVIKLERKSKIRGMTAKKSMAMSREEGLLLMRGQIPQPDAQRPQIANQILTEMKMLGMRPQCIVQYLRCAYVYPVGNVRITFDRNISGSKQTQALFDSHICTTPLLGAGLHILEVKYDNLLPRYLYDALDIGNLQQTSFSKYGYARNILG